MREAGSLVVGGGTERDEVELDALRQFHDALDDLDRVLMGRPCQRLYLFCFRELSQQEREKRAHVQEVLLDRAVVDGAVPPSVELDQRALVLDKGDKVQVCIGLERRGLCERASGRRIGESVLQAL